MTMRVSLDKIEGGIKVSLRKSEEHLAGAEILVENNFLGDAVVLIEFSIEEFGRAVILREKLQNGSTEIERKLDKDHKYKYDKAWEVLPANLKTIYYRTREPLFGLLLSNGLPWFFIKETVSPQTRIDATFVNFDAKTLEWKDTVKVDKEKLQTIIKEIKNQIKNFKY